MANIELSPPDNRAGPIRTIVTPAYSGTEHIVVKSPDVFGVKQYWRLVAAYLRATSDATVKNRYIKAFKYSPYSVRTFGIGSDALAASGTKELFIAQVDFASTAGFDAQIVGCKPDQWIIGDGNYFETYLYDGVAGDTMLAVLEFEYMNRAYRMPEVYQRMIWNPER